MAGSPTSNKFLARFKGRRVVFYERREYASWRMSEAHLAAERPFPGGYWSADFSRRWTEEFGFGTLRIDGRRKPNKFGAPVASAGTMPPTVCGTGSDQAAEDRGVEVDGAVSNRRTQRPVLTSRLRSSRRRYRTSDS